jgi:hypothetical protein
MYLTKPVIVSSPPNAASSDGSAKPALTAAGGASSQAPSLIPGRDSLPGDSSAGIKPIPADPRKALPAPPSIDSFEETNLRVQHILTAEAPGGHLDRIDIDVPVLYQSRQLRWTAAEISEARDLMVRLMDYQEKSRQLRSEGDSLLTAWNHLIGRSIPGSQLRADSPTLPENQQDAADAPRPASLISNESIEIQSSEK